MSKNSIQEKTFASDADFPLQDNGPIIADNDPSISFMNWINRFRISDIFFFFFFGKEENSFSVIQLSSDVTLSVKSETENTISLQHNVT